MIIDYLNIEQFLTVVIIHFFAVISPGPDFAVVVKQSIKFGKKSGIITSLGISIGILFHVFYCIIGIGLLISNNIFLFNLIKIIGAIYLSYLGITAIFKKKINIFTSSNKSSNLFVNYLNKPFLIGLFTNIFNPKATLFFVSLFSIVIDSHSSIYLQIFYGLWMSIITGFWFVIVSLLITSNYFKKIITEYSTIIDRLLGLVLIYISIKILFL